VGVILWQLPIKEINDFGHKIYFIKFEAENIYEYANHSQWMIYEYANEVHVIWGLILYTISLFVPSGGGAPVWERRRSSGHRVSRWDWALYQPERFDPPYWSGCHTAIIWLDRSRWIIKCNDKRHSSLLSIEIIEQLKTLMSWKIYYKTEPVEPIRHPSFTWNKNIQLYWHFMSIKLFLINLLGRCLGWLVCLW